jgi:hypothetical protein
VKTVFQSFFFSNRSRDLFHWYSLGISTKKGGHRGKEKAIAQLPELTTYHSKLKTARSALEL